MSTPQTSFVDLGTEFAVDVRSDDSTRATVLSGMVDVKSPQAGVLTAGEAIDVRREAVQRLKPLTAAEILTLLPRQVFASIDFDKLKQN